VVGYLVTYRRNVKMAKKNTSRITAEKIDREAANREAGQRREKEEAIRRTNAGKQKRYRESMKAQGYKAKLIWEKPPEPGWVKVEAPVIRENSLNVAATDPAIREVLKSLCGAFITACEKQGVPKDIWEPVYRDLLTLLKPLVGE
jgi:hypothetical protein